MCDVWTDPSPCQGARPGGDPGRAVPRVCACACGSCGSSCARSRLCAICSAVRRVVHVLFGCVLCSCAVCFCCCAHAPDPDRHETCDAFRALPLSLTPPPPHPHPAFHIDPCLPPPPLPLYTLHSCSSASLAHRRGRPCPCPCIWSCGCAPRAAAEKCGALCCRCRCRCRRAVRTAPEKVWTNKILLSSTGAPILVPPCMCGKQWITRELLSACSPNAGSSLSARERRGRAHPISRPRHWFSLTFGEPENSPSQTPATPTLVIPRAV